MTIFLMTVAFYLLVGACVYLISEQDYQALVDSTKERFIAATICMLAWPVVLWFGIRKNDK